MRTSFQIKKDVILSYFENATTPEQKFKILIDLGQKLTQKKDLALFTSEELVPGCQSLMYLKAKEREGKLFFEIFSEALISLGLAALLIQYYEGETPEDILSNPPTFLEELSLHTSLSPGRSNGVASLYLKIRQQALSFHLLNQAVLPSNAH